MSYENYKSLLEIYLQSKCIEEEVTAIEEPLVRIGFVLNVSISNLAEYYKELFVPI